MSLPEIPVLDYRVGGLPSYQRDGAERANRVMDAVVHGIGPAGRVGRAFLPLADRIAGRSVFFLALGLFTLTFRGLPGHPAGDTGIP